MGEFVKNAAIKAGAIGLAGNLLLFFVKLYIGISSNSLAIYCDAINNLGDTFACGIALLGFFMIKKMSERQSLRTQSLCTLFISLFIAATGCYFVYNGLERLMYPMPVSYSVKYAVMLAATIGVKILMGLMFRAFNRGADSSVLKALFLDSFLDCFITLAALMSLILIQRVNFAADGIFAIATGSIITLSAIRNILQEAKYLIND